MSRRRRRAGRRLALAIDTATWEGVVALGGEAGEPIAADRWPADHLHGERLLGSVRRVLEAADTSLGELAGVIVGIGPGSFTGLRVGLATAKGLAFGLGIPIAGVETAVALAAADAATGPRAGGTTVVLVPAGPGGRYRSAVELSGPAAARLSAPPTFITAGADPAVPSGARLLVLDLPDAPAAAREAGERARDGLAAALLRLGTPILAKAGPADLAELVPVYVTLPRGIGAPGGPIAWSRDPR